MTEKVITIFGTARAKPGDRAYTMALELGRALAEAGFAIANGGYAGTMLAAAKGAAAAGATVIGVTCTAFKTARPNKYLTREISTSTLDQRLDTLLDIGDDYIVLPGGTGTLLELAKVWELKNKGFLAKQKRVILVGAFWKPLLDLIASEDPDSSRYLVLAEGPEQAVQILKTQN